MSPLWVPQILVPQNVLRPTGADYETFPRQGTITQPAAITVGVLWLHGINLPAGLSVGHICWDANTTGAGTPTHWWFGLYDLNRVQLAVTADQTTTAWAASAVKNLAVATTAAGAATSFRTTYTGLHYLGVMVAATTTPTLNGGGITVGVYGQAPVMWGGTSDTAQTTPPAFPHTVTTHTASSATVYAWEGA